VKLKNEHKLFVRSLMIMVVAFALIALGAIAFVMSQSPDEPQFLELRYDRSGTPNEACRVPLEFVSSLHVSETSLPVRFDLGFADGCPTTAVILTGDYPTQTGLTAIALSNDMDGSPMVSNYFGSSHHMGDTPGLHFRDGDMTFIAHARSEEFRGTVSVFILVMPRGNGNLSGEHTVCQVAAPIATEYCEQ
jgi:hypothetical protein